MTQDKNINLQRHADGTASVLRKKTVYNDLFFYRKSDVLVQLTKAFCERFLPKYGDRTVDQMVQAARSVKQNIAEGLTDGQTSFETEIKLLGIAKGSNQELLEDYRDYMKQHHLADWAQQAKKTGNGSKPSNSSSAGNSRNASNSSNARNTGNAGGISRYDRLLAFCRTHNDLADYDPYFKRWADEEMCNTAICLCHMVDKAMATFIDMRDREFVEEGGIRERMTAARLDCRGTQKEIITRLEAENAALKARIASLECELAVMKSETSNSHA